VDGDDAESFLLGRVDQADVGQLLGAGGGRVTVEMFSWSNISSKVR
jgi:hypothetical protein